MKNHDSRRLGWRWAISFTLLLAAVLPIVYYQLNGCWPATLYWVATPPLSTILAYAIHSCVNKGR